MRSGPKPLVARPNCGVCRKPVESFKEEEGDGRLSSYVIFIARCHGAVERQKVHKRDVRSGSLSFGVAFAGPPALEPPRVRGLLGAGQSREACQRRERQ